MSYLEIYNEDLGDLLRPEDDGSNLKICEDTTGKVCCMGLSEKKVHSKQTKSTPRVDHVFCALTCA